MKKLSIAAVSAVLFLAITTIPLFSADNPDVVEAFRKNFTRGSLTTKVRVLQDSIEYENADMSALYTLSLDFVLDNTWMLADDSSGKELMQLTVRLLGTNGVTAAADNLWKFFQQTTDEDLQVEIMSALGDTAKGNADIVLGINTWLMNCNKQVKSGESCDERLVSEAVTTLGKLGDPSSFSIVFATTTAGYSESVTESAAEALGGIDGSFADHIIDVINNGETAEKIAALQAAYAQESLSRDDKAKIAIDALNTGLDTAADTADQEKELRELRYEAVRQLTGLGWAGETEKLVKHFDNTVTEYEQGVCKKANLIEAINALGISGTHDAAVRLALYLEVLNSYTENGQIVDEQIILTLIDNLGKLGDNIAFDYLLYTGYLNYSDNVQQAAREALKNLKSM